jgi:hypothetical protein
VKAFHFSLFTSNTNHIQCGEMWGDGASHLENECFHSMTKSWNTPEAHLLLCLCYPFYPLLGSSLKLSLKFGWLWWLHLRKEIGFYNLLGSDDCIASFKISFWCLKMWLALRDLLCLGPVKEFRRNWIVAVGRGWGGGFGLLRLELDHCAVLSPPKEGVR